MDTTEPAWTIKCGFSIAQTPEGCWLFQGKEDIVTVYDRTFSKNVSPHRLIWRRLRGPIKKGHWLVRIPNCQHRGCCNPDHRYTATAKQASQVRNDGKPPATHCPNGHPYTDKNTKNTPRGRKCKTCFRAKAKRKYEARKARDEILLAEMIAGNTPQ